MDGKSKNLALNYGASLEEISDAVLMEAGLGHSAIN